jgi:hypothetical protein
MSLHLDDFFQEWLKPIYKPWGMTLQIPPDKYGLTNPQKGIWSYTITNMINPQKGILSIR